MKTVVIIPSRYRSTRFEGKPLVPICGIPMIKWVYDSCLKAESVTDVMVATDDERIFERVEAFGGNVVMTSQKNRSGTDRVGEAAEKMGLGMDDIIINIQGDQPLIHPSCLDEVARPLLNDPDVGMSTLAFKIVNDREITDPKDVKVTFDKRGFALYFSRSPIPCGRDGSTGYAVYKHLGVYAYTRRFLDIFRNLAEGTLERIEKLEQLRAMEHGYRIKVVVTPHDSPEVDQPEDILRVEKKISANSK